MGERRSSARQHAATRVLKYAFHPYSLTMMERGMPRGRRWEGEKEGG
jgi:hypothetical protein